jgi:hypothetical protein
MAVWSAAFALCAGIPLLIWSPPAALALALGTACGILNALLVMRGTERLAGHASVGTFVFSSILRIVVFGVVPVEFCLHAPWWTFGIYFVGFFTPLALYAMLVARELRAN